MRAFWMILAGLTLVGTAVGTAAVTNAAERRSRNPDHDFTDEWRTAKGASPSVSLVFRGKTREVTVDGKPVAMTGGRVSLASVQVFYHFQKLEMTGKHGGESYVELGLIAGVLDSREVLSGFYTEVDHDSEGEIKRELVAPVVLFQVSPGGTPRRKR